MQKSTHKPGFCSHYDIKTCSKMHKKEYDKRGYFFRHILFAEIFDKKSYKMDIYKSARRVYNKCPE